MFLSITYTFIFSLNKSKSLNKSYPHVSLYAAYKLLQDCDTTGVFQLESDGMRGYLKKLKADCFEDIVAF